MRLLADIRTKIVLITAAFLVACGVALAVKSSRSHVQSSNAFGTIGPFATTRAAQSTGFDIARTVTSNFGDSWEIRSERPSPNHLELTLTRVDDDSLLTARFALVAIGTNGDYRLNWRLIVEGMNPEE